MKVLDTHKSKEIIDAVKDNIENKSFFFRIKVQVMFIFAII